MTRSVDWYFDFISPFSYLQTARFGDLSDDVAIVYKPVRIATRLGIFGAVLHALAPRIAQIVMNTTFRMFPDSDAAKGPKEGEKPKATADQIAFANLMRGIHF